MKHAINNNVLPSPQGTIRKIKLKDVKQTSIVEVWHDNLEKELREIVKLIEEFKVIALDTEFPGIQQVPLKVINESDFEYKMIRESVMYSKIIQIGFSICNEEGEVPADLPFSWQFNFAFDENLDQISEDTLKLLRTAGIDFDELKKRGIKRDQFAELISESDLILNEEIKWIVFHGGYDFAYLLQMLYGSAIPDSPDLFYNLLSSFFPRIYDVKYLIQSIDNIKERGLDKVAYHFRIDRIGPKHQAGSDSLLTLGVFLKLREDMIVDFDKCINTIFGIGHGFVASQVRDYLQLQKQKYVAQYEAVNNSTSTNAQIPLLFGVKELSEFQARFTANPHLTQKMFQNYHHSHASNKITMSFIPPLLAALQQQQQQHQQQSSSQQLQQQSQQNHQHNSNHHKKKHSHKI